MTQKTMHVQDRISTQDTISFSRTVGSKAPTFRTEVLFGYDLIDRPNGKSTLGEVLFEEHNETVLGGALFTLEKLFNVQSPLPVATLNEIKGIANTGTPINEIYPKDTVVCLFGVGIGGAGDTISSVYPVKFQAREIADMIPFRITDQPLTSPDDQKYWFREHRQDGKTAYYLKNFESTPTIKVLWKDGEGGEDGSEVQAGVENSTRTEPIETFIEIILKVNKKDCREFFELNGNVEQTRINTLALCTGIKGTLDDGSTDYKQVKVFSMLNINNEMLVTQKDLTVVYRIYTS